MIGIKNMTATTSIICRPPCKRSVGALYPSLGRLLIASRDNVKVAAGEELSQHCPQLGDLVSGVLAKVFHALFV
jgi:hypothetical protein